jgi:hypothetical protein
MKLCNRCSRVSVCAFIILGLFFDLRECATYNGNTKGLTSVPTDISSDVSEIFLTSNKILSVHQSNFNGKFPMLLDLRLGYNRIRTIERGCFSGTVIATIGFAFNLLTTFPDLSQVSQTVEVIILRGNHMSHILPEDVKDLLGPMHTRQPFVPG